MTDLILSPIVDLLVDRLADYIKDEYDLHSNVKRKLRNLKTALEKIRSVARAADEVEIDKYNDLEPWLRDLKEAAYKAEDVLDEFEYRSLERQVAAFEEEWSGRDRAKLLGIVFCLLFTWFITPRPPSSGF